MLHDTDICGARIVAVDRRVDGVEERVGKMVSVVNDASTSVAEHRARIEAVERACGAIPKIDRKLAWLGGAAATAVALGAAQVAMQLLAR